MAIRVEIVTASRNLRVLATNRSKRLIKEMKIPVRKAMPWQIDVTRNVIGSNPGGNKGFSLKINIKVILRWNLNISV